MRRTTLGPLTSGDLNRSLDDSRLSGAGLGTSRRSMGASGVFGGGGKATAAFPGSSRKGGPQSRISLAAGGGPGADRRDSMHIKGDFGLRLGAPLADPRAVTSRKFMDDSVKQLSEFLAETGYMGEVTPQRLLSPTSASFRSVMVHLLKMIDATYVVGPPDKFADEVQAVFKALKYPFPISKTAIAAAGAQQSWPTLLAAIMWLVTLLKYGELAVANADEAAASTGASSSFVLPYLGRGYDLFLREQDAELAALKSTMAEAFGEQHATLEAEIDRKKARNEGLQRELDALQALQARLPSANSQKAELVEDVGLKKIAMNELQAWVAQLGGRMADVKRELALKEQELHRAEAAQEALQQRLDAQEIQPADVERMGKQKAALREETAKAQADSRAAADRALALSQDLKGALERLRAATGEYNTAAAKLQIAPAGAKYSQDQNFALRVNEAFLGSLSAAASRGADAPPASAATSAALLSNDVKGVVKYGLREMKAKLARTSGETGRSVIELDDQLANVAEARADATKKIETLSRRLREREDAVAAYRSDMEAGLHVTDREIGDLSDRVAATRSDLIAAQAAVRELGPEVLRGLELQYSTQAAALNGQRARYLQSVNAALTSVGHHKSATEQKLQELAVRATEAGRRVAARAGPAAPPPPIALTAGVPARSGAAAPPVGAPHAPPSSAAAPTAVAPPSLYGSTVPRGGSRSGAVEAPAAQHVRYGNYTGDTSPLASYTYAPSAAAAAATPLQYFSSQDAIVGGAAASGGSARMSLSASGPTQSSQRYTSGALQQMSSGGGGAGSRGGGVRVEGVTGSGGAARALIM